MLQTCLARNELVTRLDGEALDQHHFRGDSLVVLTESKTRDSSVSSLREIFLVEHLGKVLLEILCWCTPTRPMLPL